MSDGFTEKEWEEAMKRFLANGGKVQQCEYGVSGIKEGGTPSPWNRGKAKKEKKEKPKK